MNSKPNYHALEKIFAYDLSEIMDQHLMEAHGLDLPALHELKLFRPEEYRKKLSGLLAIKLP